MTRREVEFRITDRIDIACKPTTSAYLRTIAKDPACMPGDAYAHKLAADEIEQLTAEVAQQRNRRYGVRCRPGSSAHSTACAIWGDDGQGHAEGFKDLQCNCGALVNFHRAESAALTAELAKARARIAELESQIGDLQLRFREITEYVRAE